MENFSYCNPTRVEFGKEKEKNIGEYIKSYGVKKVLLSYGSQRIKNDTLFDTVIKSLELHSIEYVEFSGITSNPILSKVKDGIELAKKENIDGILSVGGGSVLDCSKAISVGALSENDVWDFFIGKSVIEKLFLFLIL